MGFGEVWAPGTLKHMERLRLRRMPDAGRRRVEVGALGPGQA